MNLGILWPIHVSQQQLAGHVTLKITQVDRRGHAPLSPQTLRCIHSFSLK